MSSDFLFASVNFIESNMSTRPPQIVKYEENDNDGYSSTIGFYISLNSSAINIPLSLVPTIAFVALDALIDIQHPHLENCSSFKKKYDGLPENSIVDCITKETYRILKAIRNAVLHNRSSFTDLSNGISFSYTNDRGTFFSVECSNNSITILNSICVLLIRNMSSHDNYFETLLAAYYHHAFADISILKDDIKVPLKLFKSAIGFHPFRRNRIVNPSITIEGERYFIKRHTVALKADPTFFNQDEYVVFLDNDTCIVPGTIIDTVDGISMDEILKWRISETSSLLAHIDSPARL